MLALLVLIGADIDQVQILYPRFRFGSWRLVSSPSLTRCRRHFSVLLLAVCPRCSLSSAVTISLEDILHVRLIWSRGLHPAGMSPRQRTEPAASRATYCTRARAGGSKLSLLMETVCSRRLVSPPVLFYEHTHTHTHTPSVI